MNCGLILSEDKAPMSIIVGIDSPQSQYRWDSLQDIFSTNQDLRSKRGNLAITYSSQYVPFFAVLSMQVSSSNA